MARFVLAQVGKKGRRRTCSKPAPVVREAAELIIVWASSDGTRCALAFLEGVLELRLENDGEVIRRAHYLDIRPACDAAQQWRIDWDVESRWRRIVNRASSD